MAGRFPKNWRKEGDPPEMVEQAVSDAGLLSRARSPERPQRPKGTWNVWPVLRDPGTPGAIERGELDEVLVELREVALAHDAAEVERACRARLGN